MVREAEGKTGEREGWKDGREEDRVLGFAVLNPTYRPVHSLDSHLKHNLTNRATMVAT